MIINSDNLGLDEERERLWKSMSLSFLPIGFQGRIRRIDGAPALVERLMEMGFMPDETIRILGRVVFGDPLIVELRGTTIALRRAEAECLFV